MGPLIVTLRLEICNLVQEIAFTLHRLATDDAVLNGRVRTKGRLDSVGRGVEALPFARGAAHFRYGCRGKVFSFQGGGCFTLRSAGRKCDLSAQHVRSASDQICTLGSTPHALACKYRNKRITVLLYAVEIDKI